MRVYWKDKLHRKRCVCKVYICASTGVLMHNFQKLCFMWGELGTEFREGQAKQKRLLCTPTFLGTVTSLVPTILLGKLRLEQALKYTAQVTQSLKNPNTKHWMPPCASEKQEPGFHLFWGMQPFSWTVLSPGRAVQDPAKLWSCVPLGTYSFSVSLWLRPSNYICILGKHRQTDPYTDK